MRHASPVTLAGGKGRWLVMAVGMLALVPAVSARVAAQRIEYSSSVSASRGAFVFSEPTTSWVFDQGLLLNAEWWRLGLNLPVVMQNSSAITYIGGIPLPTGGPYSGTMAGRSSGETIPMRGRRGAGSGSGAGTGAFSDARIGTAWTLMPPSGASLVDSGAVEEPGALALNVGDPVLQAETELTLGARGTTRLGAKLLTKLPLADPESGVGTGEFDYGAGLTFSAAAARTFFFADVSHWVLGDMPDLGLRDLTSGSLGIGLTFGEMGRLSTLASVSGATAIVDNVDPPLSAGLSLGLAVREQRFVTLGATVGLSESSPDWGVTVGWRVSQRPR